MTDFTAHPLIDELTVAEKAALCTGRNYWETAEVDRLDIPSVMMSDGPHGLRVQLSRSDQIGLYSSAPATCFPTGSALAASWDRELVEAVGRAIATEARPLGVSLVLGPAINIKRSPLGGRNFEYYSEDPYLAGELGLAFVDGVQSEGVGTSVKHFAANNQETLRMVTDVEVDMRTLREIYLPAFERIIVDGKPWSVMCAYNRLNGTYCSENQWLLTTLLREEWGYDGVVVTDWGACNDRVAGVRSGQDLEMPYSGGYTTARIVEAVADGSLDVADLDRSAARILRLVSRARLIPRPSAEDGPPAPPPAEHHDLAREAARRSIVLLKNDTRADGSNALPLSPNDRVAFIGAFAAEPRFQGGGSSHVNAAVVDTAVAEARHLAGENQDGGPAGDVAYAPGYRLDTPAPDTALIEQAVKTAGEADRVVVFIGLTDQFESEGYDRTHLRVPESHIALLEAVAATTEDLVVVLCNGAPIEMPWIGIPAAVLEAYLSGEASGGAVADILFGAACPSGKLAETFPMRLADSPAYLHFPGDSRRVTYREGIFVGYRYFDTADVSPLFPFGHGLSYTRFDYDVPTISRSRIKDDEEVTVSVRVRNAGDRRGREIVQVYVRDVEATVERPEKELKGFAVLDIAPGEQEEARITLGRRAFSYWDTDEAAWRVESGEFEILVGATSRDIRGRARLRVEERRAALRKFQLNSTLGELATHPVGKLVLRRIQKEWNAGGDTEPGSAEAVMVDEMIRAMPLRAAVYLSAGRLPMSTAELLLDVMNGKRRKWELARLLRGFGR